MGMTQFCKKHGKNEKVTRKNHYTQMGEEYWNFWGNIKDIITNWLLLHSDSGIPTGINAHDPSTSDLASL